MANKRERDPLEEGIRRMGEPSWLILRALYGSLGPIPGIEIIQRVEDYLVQADWPYKELEASTLHYALRRMEDDGFVRRQGERDVDVPGPRGSTRREKRVVYAITGLGSQAVTRRDVLDRVSKRPVVAPGFMALPLEGGA